MTYDLAILGGGPAGVAAGVYASRKRLKTVFITANFEGQSAVSEGVENWIGTVKIPGLELSENLRKHLEAYAADAVDIKAGETVEGVEKLGDFHFKVKTDKGEYEAKSVLITTGSVRRKLEVPGAAEFENKGLTYCASCDGPLFAGQDCVVVGGGNAAFESAAQLLAYAKSVTLIHRTNVFRADPVTVARVSAHPNMKVISNAMPTEIKGDKFVNAIAYKDVETGEVHELPTAGIFIEIGLIPNTWFLKRVVDLTETGQIIVDPRTQQTSLRGIWAAGDATDGLYHQNNIAAGDAVKALEDIYLELMAR
jgi:alkyl hydroperoxide reductase subunit F